MTSRLFPLDIRIGLLIIGFLGILHTSAWAEITDCNVYAHDVKLPSENLKSGEIIFTPAEKNEPFSVVACNTTLQIATYTQKGFTPKIYQLRPDQCYLGPVNRERPPVLYKCQDDHLPNQECFVNANSQIINPQRIDLGQKVILPEIPGSVKPLLLICDSKIISNNYTSISLKRSECFVEVSPYGVNLYSCTKDSTPKNGEAGEF